MILHGPFWPHLLMFQGVLLGNLGTNASISVNVKGQLLVIQLLESACVHLVGLETGAMWVRT